MAQAEDFNKKTERLVKSAKIFAISNYTSLVVTHTEMMELKSCNLDVYWEDIVAVSCMGVVYMKIFDTYLMKEQSEITAAFKASLDKLQNNSFELLGDFTKYVRGMVDIGLELTDAVGSWLWVKIEEHPKASRQLKELAHSQRLSKTAAMPVIAAFDLWWKKDSEFL